MANPARPPAPLIPGTDLDGQSDGYRRSMKKTPKTREGVYSWCYAYRIVRIGHPPYAHIRATYVPKSNPAWIDPSLVDQMPEELVWPNDDIESVRTAIMALYSMDIVTLASIKAQHSDKPLGLEGYLDWVQHRIGQASLNGEALVLVPSDDKEIKTRDFLASKVVAKGVRLDLLVVRTKAGDSWGQALFRHGNSLLTKAWIDLATGEATIYEEYPGRWLAAHQPLTLVQDLLGKTRKAFRSSAGLAQAQQTSKMVAALL